MIQRSHNYHKWHEWFAWFPVYAENTNPETGTKNESRIWLEYVERICWYGIKDTSWPPCYETGHHWKYRIKGV